MSDKLISIGKIITEKRLKLSISKKKLTDDLKLPIKYLGQIETGELDENYNHLLVIRYLRIYLNYLNLDTDEIIADYKSSLLEPTITKNKALPFDYKFFNKNFIVKLLLLMSLIYLIAYKIDKNKQEKLTNNIAEKQRAFYR